MRISGQAVSTSEPSGSSKNELPTLWIRYGVRPRQRLYASSRKYASGSRQVTALAAPGTVDRLAVDALAVHRDLFTIGPIQLTGRVVLSYHILRQTSA